MGNMYCGEAIFLEQAFGYIYVQLLATFSLVEMLQAKLMLERMCLLNGVSIITFVSDTYTALSSNGFVSITNNHGQGAQHNAVGSHHYKGVTKTSIVSISDISRTIM